MVGLMGKKGIARLATEAVDIADIVT